MNNCQQPHSTEIITNDAQAGKHMTQNVNYSELSKDDNGQSRDSEAESKEPQVIVRRSRASVIVELSKLKSDKIIIAPRLKAAIG